MRKSISLYRKLRRTAKDDIAAKLKLDALLATLAHFKVKDNKEVSVFAEALLRMETLEWDKIIPADVKVAKLMEIFNYFRRNCGN